jgi:hypothetical protein
MQQVELRGADVDGINFTAVRTATAARVSAALSPELPAALRASVRAELLPAPAGAAGAKAAAAAVASAAVDASGFFELHNIAPGSYVLRLACAGESKAAGSGARSADVTSCKPWQTSLKVRAVRAMHLCVCVRVCVCVCVCVRARVCVCV